MNREQMTLSGNWLKEQRAERNITLTALGKYVNVAPTTLSRWEKSGFPFSYIRHGLQYFFEGWEKNDLRKCPLHEIPDNPQLATGRWLSWWLSTEGVRVAELADFLGVTTKCVYDWMKPDKQIPIITEYAIRRAMKELGK